MPGNACQSEYVYALLWVQVYSMKSTISKCRKGEESIGFELAVQGLRSSVYRSECTTTIPKMAVQTRRSRMPGNARQSEYCVQVCFI
jgi:hypothetical protein